MTPKFSRIRAGLYETIDKNFQIEQMNRNAEVMPFEDYYNKWRVYDYSSSPCSYEIWLTHFDTLADAKNAIQTKYEENKR
jgi:hypothetical protein